MLFIQRNELNIPEESFIRSIPANSAIIKYLDKQVNKIKKVYLPDLNEIELTNLFQEWAEGLYGMNCMLNRIELAEIL
jgi:hypothetical protein